MLNKDFFRIPSCFAIFESSIQQFPSLRRFSVEQQLRTLHLSVVTIPTAPQFLRSTVLVLLRLEKKKVKKLWTAVSALSDARRDLKTQHPFSDICFLLLCTTCLRWTAYSTRVSHHVLQDSCRAQKSYMNRVISSSMKIHVLIKTLL
jgi:hypothetical protein